MTFVSVYFFIFVAAVLLLYFVFPLKYRWGLLLVASAFFYATWGKRALVMIVATTALAYIAAIRIETCDVSDKRKKKLYLWTSVLMLIAFLAFCKMYNFNSWSISGFYVPLGISYYTFSIIGYLVDVYARKEKAERNFLKLALFVLFFPKIMQGPISKHRTLAPQLEKGHAFDYNQFRSGMQLMLWGYFKKLMIADRIAIATEKVFGNVSGYGGAVFVASVILLGIQAYCDFSGYMDIARGFCEAIGIDLDENFRRPFFAKSAAEFWRRWHISLGTWFKDYIYMPIVISPKLIKTSGILRQRCGKRVGKALMTIVPSAVVWFLTGLWHGTGAGYLAWGLWWGTLIIFSEVFASEITKLNRLLHINTEAPSWNVFRMVRTYGIFCMGLILSKPDSILDSKIILYRILKAPQISDLMNGTLFRLFGTTKQFLFLVVCIGILFLASVIQEQYKVRVRDLIAQWNVVFRWGFYVAAVILIILFGVYGPTYDMSTFEYMHY